jgi:uncharacterized membrane protein YhaH (DUF805 family)
MLFIPSIILFVFENYIEGFVPHNIFFQENIVPILILALYLLSLISQIFAQIKRFHDLNRSGFQVLLVFVPIIGIYYGLLLLFARSVMPSENSE